MHVIRTVALTASFVICSLLALSPARAQVDIAISVDVEPPPLPVYDQPPIPEPGYLWVPGYWAWDDDTGYYWVPGTWVLPPEPALLWTPGYWGWNDGVYVFHEGYWGPQIGFYGGVAYGFRLHRRRLRRRLLARRRVLLQPVGQQYFETVDHQRLQQDRGRQ